MKTIPVLSKLIPFIVIAFILVMDFYFQGHYWGILYCIPIYISSMYYSKNGVITFGLISILCIVLAYFLFYNGSSLRGFPTARFVSVTFVLSHLILLLNLDGLISISFLSKNLKAQSIKVSEELSEYANIILDNKGIINEWNTKAHQLFGLGRAKVIGKHISSLSADKDEVEGTFQKLIANLNAKSKTATNIWLKRSDGTLFWSEVKLSLIFSPSGKYIGVTLLVKDIDNQRSLEQLLNVTNNLAKVGGWEYDLTSGHLFWSETTKDIHGVPQSYIPTAAEGINFYLEGKDRNRIEHVFNNMIETGEAFEEELRIVTAGNKIKWIRTRAYPIMVNGVCKKIYGSFQDIHELKKRELELLKSQDKFKKIFKYSPYAMAMVNLKGQVLEGNKRYYQLVGYTQAELDYLTISDLTHPEDIPNDVQMFSKLDKGEVENFELDKRIFRKGGELRWVSIAISRITDEKGETDYLIAQLNDITEKKLTEKKLQEQQELLLDKNKELNQYAYITSHDLQEPVRTVHSFSSLLHTQYENIIDDTGKKYLRFINEASLRLSNQIKGLLEYSRLGKSNKDVEETDLNQILKFVTLDLSTLITENNAEIQVQDLPRINVFPTEIKLLFQNLISNAIKFQSADSSPLIKIEAEEIEGKWEFIITDNGIGIDKKFHDKIFQIFQRLHDRSQFEGSGIGLAHCKKIVELHKGNIWLESEPNNGSKFHFTVCKDL